ncbi:MAG: universal stress protein [Nitrospirae bacterium]|nr:universal stress protein [Nitrospirota bacterium]
MKKILIAIDNSPASKKILSAGASLAKKYKSKATIVAVAPTSFEGDLNENEAKLLKDAVIIRTRVILEDAAVMFKRVKLKINTVLREGDPAAEILLLAKEIKPDIIIVGSTGKGKIKRFFLGSVSRKIVELAKFSVLVVK